MDRSTRDTVWRRAGDACEYCRMPQIATPLIPFHVEHIIARQRLWPRQHVLFEPG